MMTKDQLRSMLQLQGEMNEKVNPQWLSAGYPFLRAVALEGAEAIEHAGWKWWKAQTRDLRQLQMELVDIWHFALSDILVHTHKNPDDLDPEDLILEQIDRRGDPIVFDDRYYYIIDMDELSRLELLIGMATVRRFDAGLFEALLEGCGMDWDDLCKQYVCKNVLNFFRQDNGYKEGTYQKIWDGREDNEHLTEIMLTTDATAPNFRDVLYARLTTRYAHAAVIPAP